MAPTHARLLPCVLLLASSFGARAHAQATSAPHAKQPAAAQPAPEPSEPADSAAEPDAAQAELADEEAEMAAESAASAARRQQLNVYHRAELTRALQAVEREQQDTSRLLPLLTTGTGLALLAVGVAIGAGKALSCDDSCTMPFWPAWFVIGGGSVATAGGIWLALKDRDLAELQSRRYQIETQLRYLEWSASLQPPRAASGSVARASLTLRF